jgi:hypothetical protein
MRDNSVVSVLSASGSVASFFGLAIAIVQILQLKDVSQAAKDASEQTQKELAKYSALSSISKAVEMSRDIQSLFRRDKLEAAEIRLSEFTRLLSHYKSIEALRTHDNFEALRSDLKVELINLNARTDPPKKDFNFEKVNSAIGRVRSILIDVEGELKLNTNQKE